MHQILVALLEQLGIALGWEELDNTESLDEYIVFSIYDEEDSNITIDGNLTETYYNTILILKGILICGSIITISIVLTTATQNNKRR